MPGDTPNCGSCGGSEGNPNPLDACGKQFLSCDNPCQIESHNTVACESLPSRVENFTKNFFGDVVRTEVNGQIVWSLPCGLDVGLPSNPRGIDEGLACYFLRLFNDGIIGLTGPAGQPGATGPQGHNAYTVTLAPFVTPAVGGTVDVQTFYNPSMLRGGYVLVDGSGWYQITNVTLGGVLTLRLLVAVPGAGVIPAGKLVVPSGSPGMTIPGDKGDLGPTGPIGPIGPQGDKGDKGDQGPAGDNFLANNGYVTLAGGSDYTVNSAGAYATINNGATDFSFIATQIGTYLVVASFDVLNIAATGGGGYVISNISLNTPIQGSFSAPTNASGQRLNVCIQALVTTTALNQTLGVQAAGNGNGQVQADSTALSWFQIA